MTTAANMSTRAKVAHKRLFGSDNLLLVPYPQNRGKRSRNNSLRISIGAVQPFESGYVASDALYTRVNKVCQILVKLPANAWQNLFFGTRCVTMANQTQIQGTAPEKCA